MPLRVAPCPKCQQPLVFGERSCRTCGQVFNYGTRNPPEPSFAQTVEALRAAGFPPPSLDDDAHAPVAAMPTRPPAPAARSVPSGAPVRDVPEMPGIETGRFASVGAVAIEDVPGFMDSGIYRAFTPSDVRVQPVAGLDTGRAEEVGAVRVQRVAEVEATVRDAVGEVRGQDVPGLFHSDFLRAPDAPVRAPAIEGLEVSPRGLERKGKPVPATKAKRKGQADLARVRCQCGESHHLPRCPACGTRHRDATD
jgi:hypothetical protein